MTSISAAALEAEYGLVGSSVACSMLAAPLLKLASPYTSSVETWRKRLILPQRRADSSSVCVPYTLFCVKERLFPKLLSTCDCAAKCMIVSISSSFIRCSSRSVDVRSPFTNWGPAVLSALPA